MPWSVVVPDGADENVVEATVRELEAAGLDPVLVAGAAQAVPSHADDGCILVTAGTAAAVGAVEGLLAARARHPVRAVRALATTAEGTITVDLVDGELGAAALAAGSAAAVLDAFGDSRITTWWVDGSELGLGA